MIRCTFAGLAFLVTAALGRHLSERVVIHGSPAPIGDLYRVLVNMADVHDTATGLLHRWSGALCLGPQIRNHLPTSSFVRCPRTPALADMPQTI